MTLDFQNRALISLDMPSWANNANGVQLLVDGDMELNNVVNWTAQAGAVATKETVTPYSGVRCLRNTCAGLERFVFNNSFVPTVGYTYRYRGYARGDGVSYPAIYDPFGAIRYWGGTSAGTWQYFDFTYVCNFAGVPLMYKLVAGGNYVEFDDITLELCPASTRNLGTLGGYAQLGDGVTPATFPTQVFPHGMSFDGASDYLLAYTGTALDFPTPAPFSFEMLIRLPTALPGVGASRGFMIVQPAGAGSIPWLFDEYNLGGVQFLRFQSFDGAATLRGVLINGVTLAQWPRSVLAHVAGTFDGTTWTLYKNAQVLATSVAAGCYAATGGASNMYVYRQQAGNYTDGIVYNAAIYPFALQPGEVAQLYQQRRSLLNRGA